MCLPCHFRSEHVDVDVVYYYICWRIKLEGETENIGVCTKERKGVSAEVLMATLVWKFATVKPNSPA